MVNDDFESVFKDHPLKVIRLSWLIAGSIVALFSVLVSGYFFWDKKLDDLQSEMQTKIEIVQNTTNSMNTNVNVVDTKISYIQRQIDELKDLMLAKNYRSEQKVRAEARP